MRVKEHPWAFHFALDVGRPYRAAAHDAWAADPSMGLGNTVWDGGQTTLGQAGFYLPPQCIVGGARSSPLDGCPILLAYDVAIKHLSALVTHAGSRTAWF
jgi:hypothetical protein